jgi:hypothetical protein
LCIYEEIDSLAQLGEYFAQSDGGEVARNQAIELCIISL